MRKDLAIVGYGRFGRLAARHLRKHFNVLVTDVQPNPNIERGIKHVSLLKATEAHLVVLAVPINKLQSVLKTIAPHVRGGTLVMDVCSVKEQPVKWMERLLPSGVSILGTHPLFGPDSAGNSLRGLHIALCPVRIADKQLDHVEVFLRHLHLVVHQTTPEEHDRTMASTLFLAQLVGRAAASMTLGEPVFETHNAQMLRHISLTSCRDSYELFRDMYRYNRFARAIPHELLRHLRRQIRSLDDG